MSIISLVNLGISCAHMATERLSSFPGKVEGGVCLDIACNRCEAAELNPKPQHSSCGVVVVCEHPAAPMKNLFSLSSALLS